MKTRKPSAKPDDPEQSKRFIEAARIAGASEDPKDFDRAFNKIVIIPPKRRVSKK